MEDTMPPVRSGGVWALPHRRCPRYLLPDDVCGLRALCTPQPGIGGFTCSSPLYFWPLAI